MDCEKYNNKQCVGKFWCGICPLYVYDGNPNYSHAPTPIQVFAMKAQQEFYKHYQEYVCKGNDEKSMSYYSCIQILEKLLRENNNQ